MTTDAQDGRDARNTPDPRAADPRAADTQAADTEPGAAARHAWESWHTRRTAEVAAPYGPLSVTATLWLADAYDGRLPGLPGQWTDPEDGDGVLLRGSVADGIAVDGELLAGEVRLGPDAGPPERSRVSYGERRLVLMHREDQWAVRVFDPGATARRAFAGIEIFPYAPEWVRAGEFRPYGSGERSVRVGNADGVQRGLGLAGELAFAGPDGAEHTLRVTRYQDGGLWAVLADGTSGRTSYRFRFLYTPPPEPETGAVAVDFNRTVLPPCAFTDHFLCPFPPPGNTLPFEVPAGERELSEGR